jgi:predicted nucleotidyltransferase
MAEQLAALRIDYEALAEICRRARVGALWMFGSGARGEVRPDSDIDLMVSFLPDAPQTISAYLDLKEEFERLFGREVDLVEKGMIRNPFRRQSIERDLTVLYAAESG